MPGILDGVRVLDLTRFISGNSCCKTLGDMGADVIRIEEPAGSDDRYAAPYAPNGESMMSIPINCNKRGVTLNYRSTKGKELFNKFLQWADIVIENFGVSAKQSMGLTESELRKINHRLILISISAFGLSGPFSDYIGFDSIAQAESGIMSMTGFKPGEPNKAGVPIIDFNTGTHAALAAVLALYHREKTGVAQAVDLSLFDVAASMCIGFSIAAEYKILGNIREPVGLRTYAVYCDGFDAKDGKVFIAATTQGIWKNFCKIIGREDLIENPELKDDYHRYINHSIADPIVQEWVSDKTVNEVLDILHEGHIPCAPINTIRELVEHPQIKHREMIVKKDYPGIGEFPYPGVTLKFSKSPGSIRKGAPKLGEDNDEVYSKVLGLNAEQINKLREEKII